MSNFISKLFGGGNKGDGGAAEMRAQEEERKRRIRASINSINQIFGGDIVEDGPPLPPQPAPGIAGQFGIKLPSQPTTVTSAAPGQFSDDYFKSIADSFMNFQTPLLEEQAAEARRVLPFGFGSTGSSAFIRKKGELERDIERQRAQVGDQALDFSNKQRQQVEQNRADLVSLASSGLDASAVASMSNARAAALAKPPVFSPIADLFQKYTALAANNPQVMQGFPFMQRRSTLSPSGNSNAVRVVEG